ncbi:MAG: hypothetical protein HC890_13490 [Chloroflexaceae bacterium]|nr:hypothetical protein [Chloroflexaceae bacterium]
MHLVTLENRQLREIYVTWNGDRFLEVSGQLSTPQLADYFPWVGVDLLAPAYPDGYRTEVNLAALDWLATVTQKLQQGYLLTIDYGYSSTRYYNPQRHQGTLQCYHQHRRHSDPYRNLGQQDITAHVDFTALERHGQHLGWQTLGLTKQGLLLMALGIGDRLSGLASGNYSVLEVLQRRDALHQLIDPAGLGNFVVLLQGKNLRPHQQRLRV